MISRRQFLTESLVGMGALALAPEWLLAESNKDAVKITILHTNDMHSRIEPFPNDGRKFAGLGGMARRAELIKQIRSQEANVLLLDAGDIIQGTPYFNFYGGEVELKLMSQMGYDAATIGNHEFDNGIAGFNKFLPHANFPYLIANYDFSGEESLKNAFQPYKIFEKQGIRIGVFGLGIQLKGLVLDKFYGNTKYLDPVGTAKEMVQTLKAKKCDLIICLSHLGYRYDDEPHKISDYKLAQAVEGIDLIIGGHTHTFLDKPEQVTHPNGHITLINQVGWAGIRLGRVDFIFEKGKRKPAKNANYAIR
ncbi:Calcineurin-like phosphoesterase [Raineya orbicola]|jgi:5'-nucleotidase|uniref:Calcineurin-like phosphoesterase n=1 Tax=Raineya orbicola TaxID=2016530 RepID=A0A2N3IJK0_9BACT|nr:metallophosphatase [Raineya orbicola]PKQ70451.1 Calcineurin-like phosphoesterase [Raineya orbicola]